MTTSSQTTSRAADLAPVAEALSALVAEFAELPRPYIYLFTTRPMIGIQLDDPQEFELWREALEVPSAEVSLLASAASAWLKASGRFRGVVFELSGHGVPLTQEQVNASQAVAA
ncbi:hypothetical protein [Streptomyces canus]|uniref:hypothetical protein n=1 Tax=Streptomyces canus TaxID=58343 RepID=UPI0033A28887